MEFNLYYDYYGSFIYEIEITSHLEYPLKANVLFFNPTPERIVNWYSETYTENGKFITHMNSNEDLIGLDKYGY